MDDNFCRQQLKIARELAEKNADPITKMRFLDLALHYERYFLVSAKAREEKTCSRGNPD